MSEKPESPDAAEAGANGSDSDSAPPTGQDATQESAGQDPARNRGAVWPGVAALIIALLALGLSGWQWWQAQEADGSDDAVEQRRAQSERIEQAAGELQALADRVDGHDGRLDEQAGQFDALRERLQALGDRVDGLDGRLDEQAADVEAAREEVSGADARLDPLRNADDRLGDRLDALAAQLDEVEESLSSRLSQRDDQQARELAEEARDAAFRLGLIEIAGLLRLGQARAELAGDLAAARGAYARAERRLGELDDDRLERLAGVLGREREALENAEQPDWSSAASRLEALVDEVGDWPRVRSASAGEAAETADLSEDDGGLWQGMRNSLGKLVRISPREQAPLTPAAMESVRERVRLHLVAAQAAVARRNREDLAHYARAGAELARAHFDSGAATVERALNALAEIEAVPAAQLPALGEALAEVNRRLADS